MSPRDFLNYPVPVKAADTPYTNLSPNNPTLSGRPLSILSAVVVNVGPLQQLFWHNTGFSQLLLKVESTGVLDPFVPRYDPTVTPIDKNAAGPALGEGVPIVDPPPKSVFYSSADYINAYKSGATTPTQVAERFLESLEKDNKDLIFITVVSRDVLLAAAEASAARYAAGTDLPLDGVPFTVKDEADVAGTPKTLGLSIEEATRRGVGVAEKGKSSWCVQKLLDAGMLFLGKTNMHEIGLDTTNNNPNWGTPPNPYNQGFYPGGSSGGSAASVGAGLAPISVGADGGGSIRVPAAYCGIYGLKPTHGRVSSAPTTSIAPTTGVVGPIAATMADLEIAYRIMATPDPTSAFPPPLPPTTPSPKVLGIYTPWVTDCDPAVLTATQAAITHFRDKLGYKVVEITIPHLPESRSAHAITILSEISTIFCHGSTHGLSPANKILVSIGTRIPGRDFLIAQKLRALLMSHLAFLYQENPGMIIVTPTAPHAGVAIAPGIAAKGGAGLSDSNTALKTMLYLFLANWTGNPAISIPCGYCPESGMPVGLMGMAEWGGEEELIRWGKEWEAEFDGGLKTAEEGGRRRGSGWVDLLKSGE